MEPVNKLVLSDVGTFQELVWTQHSTPLDLLTALGGPGLGSLVNGVAARGVTMPLWVSMSRGSIGHTEVRWGGGKQTKSTCAYAVLPSNQITSHDY